MHSSRMRTGRSLTVCCSLHPGGRGGVCLVWGVSARSGGSAWSGGVQPGPRGGLPGRGGSPCPGYSAWSGGVCLVWGGVCLVWGGSPCPAGWGVCPETPPVNRITHTCKIIALATTSLRPVTRPRFHKVITKTGSLTHSIRLTWANLCPKLSHSFSMRTSKPLMVR